MPSPTATNIFISGGSGRERIQWKSKSYTKQQLKQILKRHNIHVFFNGSTPSLTKSVRLDYMIAPGRQPSTSSQKVLDRHPEAKVMTWESFAHRYINSDGGTGGVGAGGIGTMQNKSKSKTQAETKSSSSSLSSASSLDMLSSREQKTLFDLMTKIGVKFGGKAQRDKRIGVTDEQDQMDGIERQMKFAVRRYGGGANREKTKKTLSSSVVCGGVGS